MRLRALLLALALAPAAAGAHELEEMEEEVVAALSQNLVSITADFAGSELFVFGAVKRESPAPQGPLDVIIAVTGPAERVVVRRKERRLGIWVNTDSVEIDAAPSFYAVAATGPLEEVLSRTDDLRYRIGLDESVRLVGAPPVENPEAFRRSVIRLRSGAGLYYTSEAVGLVEDTLFTAYFQLPANLVEGDYLARIFILRDKAVIDRFETSIAVRKVGLERWLYNLSREQPLLYGLLSIFVALAAGWGASEAFRLMRR